jgi:CheY-like chemotaxis protein
VATTILIVEDTPHTLELMTYLLNAHGHTVVSTDDGEHAVTLAMDSSPDLIVMDIQLPGIVDGFEAMRQIRSSPRLAMVPIVAVTAYAMVGDRETALRAGFTNYLTKPIDPYAFATEIDRNLPPAKRGQPVPAVAASVVPPRAELAVSRDEPTEAVASVLVVDDHPTNIELLRCILEPHGYRISSASTIDEAVGRVRTDRPDLVLSDVHLGGESGFDLWRRLQDDAELASVPFAFTTATATLLDAVPRSVTVIRRPVEPRPLLDKIRELLTEAARS